MNCSTAPPSRYVLSFTTGGLLEREAAVLVAVYAQQRDWARVRQVAVEANLLQARTRTTRVRRVRLTVNRLATLSDRELELLSDVTPSERAQLMWVAACRRYDLIGEFAEEVLRERFLTLAGGVSHAEYDSFYCAKEMWHDELADVSRATYTKLRQVLFRMMVEAGLLTTAGEIEPALLSPRLVSCLTERTPSDLRFFPTRVV